MDEQASNTIHCWTQYFLYKTIGCRLSTSKQVLMRMIFRYNTFVNIISRIFSKILYLQKYI